MRCASGTLAFLVFLAAAASGQVWDSDRERGRPGPSVFDLITGQFPRHGRTYYEDRALRREARLIRGLFDLETRNDLAAACIQLGEVGRARTILSIVESMSPGRPEVLYNLGACAKREGDFRGALALATRAGADELELKSLAWRAGLTAGFSDRDFLGVPYQDWPRAAELAGYEDLLKLIARDREFADAYLVLGDELFRRGVRNLSIWAWVRALHLGHPAVFHIRRRLDFAFYMAGAGGGRDSDPVESAIRGISARLDEARSWLQRFDEVESRLVHEGRDPDFAMVEREGVRRLPRKLSPTSFAAVPVSPAELALAEPPVPSSTSIERGPEPTAFPWRSLLCAAFMIAIAWGLSAALRSIPRWSPRRERPLNVRGCA